VLLRNGPQVGGDDGESDFVERELIEWLPKFFEVAGVLRLRSRPEFLGTDLEVVFDD